MQGARPNDARLLPSLERRPALEARVFLEAESEGEPEGELERSGTLASGPKVAKAERGLALCGPERLEPGAP